MAKFSKDVYGHYGNAYANVPCSNNTLDAYEGRISTYYPGLGGLILSGLPCSICGAPRSKKNSGKEWCYYCESKLPQ
jgi:hypothetical protein